MTLELPVYNMDGQVVDTLRIDEAVFGDKVRKTVLREALLMFQANQRAGTGSAKNRGEVNGTRKKPFRQKGTGRARQGSWIAPHHIGGGIAHGPHPREFRYAIPKKARRLALQSAFLDKLQTATHVIDQIKLPAPKTKQMAQLLRKLDVNGTCLIATFGVSDVVIKSARNLPGVTVKRVRDVNALDLLRPRNFVVTRRAIESVVERFAAENGKGGGA